MTTETLLGRDREGRHFECSDRNAMDSRDRIVTARRDEGEQISRKISTRCDRSFKETASRGFPLRRPTTTLSEKLVERKRSNGTKLESGGEIAARMER